MRGGLEQEIVDLLFFLDGASVWWGRVFPGIWFLVLFLSFDGDEIGIMYEELRVGFPKCLYV